MSASDLVERLHADLRDDLEETSEQPVRETAEAVVLGVVGLGWLLRSVTHVIGYLALTDAADPHPLATDWGVRASPVTAAHAGTRWRLGLASCGVGIVLCAGLAPGVGPLWDAGRLVGGVALANAGVLVGDPILVQVLPDG